MADSAAPTKPSKQRRFAADAPPHPCLAAVPHEFWPSTSQFAMWWKYVDDSIQPTDDGWFMSYCPVHDPLAATTPTGMINFQTGAIRCLRDESCCAPKNAMSLQNVIVKRAGLSDAAAG